MGFMSPHCDLGAPSVIWGHPMGSRAPNGVFGVTLWDPGHPMGFWGSPYGIQGTQWGCGGTQW